MRGHLKRVALGAILVAALQLAAAAAAQARDAVFDPCPGGTRGTVCRLWTGKVTFIGDGDTVSVDVKGDGTRKPVRVRLTGIQAMEEHVYTSDPAQRVGECHANEATARVEQLVKASKGRVRLAAQHASSHSGVRARRTVAVRSGGKWVDVGRTLVREGHALFLANGSEWAWNHALSTLAQKAQPRGLNLWNPEQCGVGPPANVRVAVFADPEGPDVDGEWVKVRNLDPVNRLPLGNWWLRDSGLRRFTFPAQAVVAPGGTLTVWVGQGIGNATNLFWNLRGAVFDNPRAATSGGDGAYLFDPDGDLRASMQYPCRYSCADPYRGAVQIRAKYAGNEYVTFRNSSAAPVDLENYRVESKPHTYVFGPDSLLQPGEEIRLEILGNPDTDTHSRRHWGLDGPILGNRGDHVALTNLRYVRIGCYSWGRGTCAVAPPSKR